MQQGEAPPPVAGYTQVRLTLSCRDLPDLDVLSKSDPQIVLSTPRADGAGRHRELDRTEVIMDDLNPSFVHAFVLDYRFESDKALRFTVLDIDDFSRTATGDGFAGQEQIGHVDVHLGDLVAAGRVERAIQHREGLLRSNGYMIIRAEEVEHAGMAVSMRMRARGLDRKNTFWRSDPFLVIRRRQAAAEEDDAWATVYRSEVLKGTLNPQWAPIHMALSTLCNGDQRAPLRLEVWANRSNGNHELIGLTETTLEEIPARREYYLRNEKMAEKRGASYKNSGVLHVQDVEMIKVPSFLDYIRGGCEVQLMVAIDFTRSNGDPNLPDSLHYRKADNEYVTAIRAVGDILAYYDTDKRFPVYGFGAKVPPDNRVSHCFALRDFAGGDDDDGETATPVGATASQQSVDVTNVSGIVTAYRRALSHVVLHGPTVFHEVMDRASAIARGSCTQSSQQYTVLLIITDGVVSDMDATIDAVVRASSLPLSIVIVGVGHADFTDMERLDADDEPLWSHALHRFMDRDIVQFVPFRTMGSGADLAREVLREIPDQLLSFMRSQGILPNNYRLNVAESASRDSVLQAALDEGHAREDIEAALAQLEEDAGAAELIFDRIAIQRLAVMLVMRSRRRSGSNASLDGGAGSAAALAPESAAAPLSQGTLRAHIHAALQRLERLGDGVDELCLICVDEKKNALFYKCGHIACCFDCASSFLSRACPVCRAPVDDVVRCFPT